MYRVDILPESIDEEEYAVIISVIQEMLKFEDYPKDFIAKKTRRTSVNVPAWGDISRHERFRNNF